MSLPVIDEHGESDGLAPGLIGEYSSELGKIVRVDSDVQFNWDTGAPDPRVSAKTFRVEWRGKIMVPRTGLYLFHFHGIGRAQLHIAGRSMIDASSNRIDWMSSKAIALELGPQPIEVHYEKTGAEARIGLYWETTSFRLEPVSPRWLVHERDGAQDAIEFERGRELVRGFRCASCHTVSGMEKPSPAPSLSKIAGRMNRQWLVERLMAEHRADTSSRMPAMALSRDDAEAAAQYLLQSKSIEAKSTDKGDRETGRSLFNTIGCLACHSVEPGDTKFATGGRLDQIASKRPPQFFRDWLRKPAELNPDHRMPVFSLTNDEIDHLASYLGTLGEWRKEDLATEDGQLAARGKRVLKAYRCAACHAVPDLDRPMLVSKLTASQFEGDVALQQSSCLGAVDSMGHRPGYNLDQADRRAIGAFLRDWPEQPSQLSRFEMGRQLLRDSNCLNCHSRDLERGLEPAQVGDGLSGGNDAELAKLRGELEPPSITAVGDKFRDATLATLVQGGAAVRRPWLKVRMPRFSLTAEQRDLMTSFLIDHDRVPVPAPEPALTREEQREAVRTVESLDAATSLIAGHQLVSARGFGCMSCHTVGKHQPKGIAANARGSDLLGIGDRVRHEWFLRWVRDPARIVPGMEMPAIAVPVAGLLDQRLDLQIESLWRALNSPSFVVPSDRDTAQQILSLAADDAPVVLRDVMFDCPPGSAWCPRSFAIGLPNRHNVLLDIDTMSLRGWWFGDFARERTEGKTWLWEPAGLPVWWWSSRTASLPTIALTRKDTGEILLPDRVGQSVGELVGWERAQGGVRAEYAVRFGGTRVKVLASFVPLFRVGRNGFTRDLSVQDVPDGFEPLMLHSSLSSKLTATELSVLGPLGQTVLRTGPEHPWEQAFLKSTSETSYSIARGQPSKSDSEIFFTTLARDEAGHYRGNWTYDISGAAGLEAETRATTVSRPGIQTPDSASSAIKKVPAKAVRAPERFAVAPGVDAVRLPLDRAVMPTAIAFRPNGTPIVSSLKGQVFVALDRDDDGYEDAWQPISDHLAAPFGLRVEGNYVLVAHKPELLRLELQNDWTGVRRSDVRVSGWGYTEDYHDWTFGILKDADGNLYLSTASDYTHKNRPEVARRLRGRILRVTPENEIEEIARGARYPTGLAMNRDGAVFFTDNQGVQNTFNEINHLVPGSRYGVPSQGDPPPERDPWPERPAAIQIPHPWTRSINGICFLDSGGKWGEFEGHGIGCEYDTRGLIRFTLQRVEDTYQGACYPLTPPEGAEQNRHSDSASGASRLLGPIACAVSPNGDLYVGSIRDSGWGGGSNVGELARIIPPSQLPLGIREVLATRTGFTIEFTGLVDRDRAADPNQYAISSYRRIWQGTYATPDSDRRTERFLSVRVLSERQVEVELDAMRTGFVYEIHVRNVGGDHQLLWPAEAYYTLNALPKSR